MLLLVDAGNSRIKWALIDAGASSSAGLGKWAQSGSVEGDDVSQLTQAWSAIGKARAITRVIISNVAGPAMRERLDHVLAVLRKNGAGPAAIEWFASTEAAGGVRNLYHNPAQLGCDRFAAAIGAHAMFPDFSLVVASCGTATTIDAVTGEGEFLGGMILPGLALMATSLASNTAQLPKVGPDIAQAALFADNTDDAIVSGCVAAQAGAIEHAVAARARHCGEVQCILSGGASVSIAPHLSVPCVRIDNLVLIGLQALLSAT
jgi:type III pantothenate kinase